MHVDGLFSTFKQELKREIPYKQELIQAFVLASWVIAIANFGSNRIPDSNTFTLPVFLNFITWTFYHMSSFCWEDSNKVEFSYVMITFSFIASVLYTVGGVRGSKSIEVVGSTNIAAGQPGFVAVGGDSYYQADQVVTIFNWFTFALLSQDAVNDFLE